MKNKLKELCSYFHTAWEKTRFYLIIIIIRNSFTAAIPLINIFGLGIVVEAITAGSSEKDTVITILIYLSVNLVISLISQLLQLAENNAMRKASNVLQFEYMEDCLDIDCHYVQDGQVVNLKRKSMSAQPAFSLSSYGDCLKYLIQAIGAISVFIFYSPFFISIICIISAALIFLTIYTQRKDYEFNNEKVEYDRRLEYLYDVMTKYKYAKEIRINNAADYIKKKYTETFMIYMKKLACLINKKTGISMLSVFLSSVQAAAMYLYFTYQVAAGHISISQYTVMIASTTLFTGVLLSFFRSAGLVNNSLKSAHYYRKYNEIMKLNSQLSAGNRLPDININFSDAAIVFENVSFKYPGTDTFILKNINITIRPHKRLAVVGLNGSGKTTLSKLILRLYSPTEGKITLGGYDISKIPYRQYAVHLGVILQDFSLFAYSLKENIIFDGIYNRDALTKSIKLSDLSERVSRLPHGIETSVYRELDDAGIELSGGEGQKLAMARAIYKNADVCLFDEPTSALDPAAEYKLFESLDKISKNKTTVFISHRISSTHFCDDIAVLDGGTVIEYGNHTSLMKKNGFYADLYRLQAKYYNENGVKLPL